MANEDKTMKIYRHYGTSRRDLVVGAATLLMVFGTTNCAQFAGVGMVAEGYRREADEAGSRKVTKTLVIPFNGENPQFIDAIPEKELKAMKEYSAIAKIEVWTPPMTPTFASDTIETRVVITYLPFGLDGTLRRLMNSRAQGFDVDGRTAGIKAGVPFSLPGADRINGGEGRNPISTTATLAELRKALEENKDPYFGTLYEGAMWGVRQEGVAPSAVAPYTVDGPDEDGERVHFEVILPDGVKEGEFGKAGLVYQHRKDGEVFNYSDSGYQPTSTNTSEDPPWTKFALGAKVGGDLDGLEVDGDGHSLEGYRTRAQIIERTTNLSSGEGTQKFYSPAWVNVYHQDGTLKHRLILDTYDQNPPQKFDGEVGNTGLIAGIRRPKPQPQPQPQPQVVQFDGGSGSGTLNFYDNRKFITIYPGFGNGAADGGMSIDAGNTASVPQGTGPDAGGNTAPTTNGAPDAGPPALPPSPPQTEPDDEREEEIFDEDTDGGTLDAPDADVESPGSIPGPGGGPSTRRDAGPAPEDLSFCPNNACPPDREEHHPHKKKGTKHATGPNAGPPPAPAAAPAPVGTADAGCEKTEKKELGFYLPIVGDVTISTSTTTNPQGNIVRGSTTINGVEINPIEGDGKGGWKQKVLRIYPNSYSVETNCLDGGTIADGGVELKPCRDPNAPPKPKGP